MYQIPGTVIGLTLLAVIFTGCGGASQPASAPAGGGAAPAGSPAAAPAAVSPVAAPAVSPGAAPASSGAVAIAGPYEGEAKSLNGAGATFPAVLYTKWFAEYDRLTGVQVNYQSIGSGGGIKSIQDGTVDFGATDAPMTDEQLAAAKGPVLHIPTAIGGVAVTYNVPDDGNTPIKLTPETLAGIFLGDIAKWNDPKLVADNPGLANVNQEIVTVHRSDGSGTTSIFVDYLSTVSPAWAQKVGRGTAVNWPNGLGGKGNEGVAGEVKQNPYAIGYVEVIYALQNKLGVAQVKNKAGNFVDAKLDTVTAAAAGVADTIAPDLRASIVDAAGAQAYPISGFTYLLIYQNPTDRAKAIALTRLAWWGTHEAQSYNSTLEYSPLPEGIVRRAEEKIRSVTVGGQPAFPGR